MSETKKYKRNSGATTIVRKGRIIGNIGGGKTPPNNNGNSKVKKVQQDITKNSQIDTMYEKYNNQYLMLHHSESLLNSQEIEESLSLEQLKTLWDISPNDDIIKKLETFTVLSKNLSTAETTIFVDSILDHNSECGQKITDKLYLDDDNLSVDMLHLLSHSKDEETMHVVLGHPNLNMTTFSYWSKSEDINRRRIIAKHWRISQEVLANLVDDEDTDVKCSIVFRRNVDPKILSQLAQDTLYEVRRSVSLHKDASAETLEFLVQDSYKNNNLDVRDIVANNPSAPPRLLAQLATQKSIFTDPDTLNCTKRTLLGVSMNTSSPSHILYRLLKNSSQEVSYQSLSVMIHQLIMAQHNENRLETKVEQLHKVLVEVAQDKTMPQDVLLRLSEYSDKRISTIAQNSLKQ